MGSTPKSGTFPQWAMRNLNSFQFAPALKPFLEKENDHVTGQFRGWICHGCNTGIGLLGDTVDSVKAALDYMAFCAPR